MHLESGSASRVAPRYFARFMIIVAAAVASTLLTSCKHGPDATTPKKAAALFVLAAQNGDMEAMHQVATGTDGEFELARGLGQLTQAFGRFSEAATVKFGTDGNTRGMSIDLANEYANAEEKIDGDTAVLIPKSEGTEESEPTHLKKDGNNWKVDLSFLDRDATAKQFSEKMPAIAKIWDQATQEVSAGKFDKFSAAKTAVAYRIDIARAGEAEGKVIAAHADIASLSNALDLYKADAAEFPSSSDGLLALTQKPASATNWHGPYLKTTITADPWGNAYIYLNPGIHNTSAFDLHSIGPDGKEGTADDINNWGPTP